MDEFRIFKEKFQKHFAEMTKDVTKLFEVEIDKDEFYNLYLDSFLEGTNNIYRERREYDCSCCRAFIKNIGNAVCIKENHVETLWDFDAESTTFQPVIDALAAYLKQRAVTNVYVAKQSKIGTDFNREILPDGNVIKWDHFYLELPNKFVDNSDRSEGDIKGGFRDVKNVFQRSLNEFDKESVMTVLELIDANTLYRGQEWKKPLKDFLKYKKQYDKLTSEVEKNNYCWVTSIIAGPVVGKIRNHSIGTLLIDIAAGVDLDVAVTKYEKVTAPENYKRPVEIITKKMKEDAQKFVIKNGLENSLGRRHACLDDITVNNILFSNRDSAKHIEGALSVFDMLQTKDNPKKFSKVEEITIDKFIENVLSTASEVEVYLENKHEVNMVSLIAPINRDAKPITKWGNNFGWAYSGNLTDSSMKERVKAAGGKVDGVLRYSIQWNDIEKDENDLDAHCITPNKHEIYYGDKVDNKTKGNLDVDIIQPGQRVAVENITWPEKSKMTPGTYRFFVHCFSNRGGRSGFRAEIEFDGQIYSFDYRYELRQKESVPVAEVTLDNDGNFSIKELMPSNKSSKDLWNVKTNEFIPVSVVMYSPNYWDEQTGIGHKHVFFMLKDCKNPENPNGFFNEYLPEEYMKHKKVFAALGSAMKVEDSDEQLSGVGFSTTKRAEVIVKVKGATERIMKVKF